MRPRIYATLLTKDSYLPGVLVLDVSLRSVGTKYPLVVLTIDTLSADSVAIIKKRGLEILQVPRLDPLAGTHNLPEQDARFADTWTKLRAFDLTQYERIVMLDSDSLVRRNMDELQTLDIPEGWIAASHACACNPRQLPHYPADWKPENCAHTSVEHPTGLDSPPVVLPTSPRPYNILNSGMVVLQPNHELFLELVHHLHTEPNVISYQFCDQDLISEHFRGKWKVLPWCYNALKTVRTTHKNLWRDDEVRFLHYILADKPWLDREGGGDYRAVHQWWWDRFDILVEEMRTSDPEGLRFVEKYVNQKGRV